MNTIVFVVLTVVVIVLITYATSCASCNEKTHQHPSMVHINNTIDNAYFFRRMNEMDLKARGASSIGEYIQTYKNSVVPFTPQEKEKLLELTRKADEVLSGYKIGDIPWRFAKLSNNIEYGYPHTLADTIFLSSIPSVQTLIHEKVHVYQRLYPIETSRLIQDVWGFRTKEKLENIENARNNPDNDSFLYGKEGYFVAQVYSSAALHDSLPQIIYADKIEPATPQKLGMPSSVKQIEHPFEMMACLIPQILLGIVSSDQPKLLYITNAWIKENL